MNESLGTQIDSEILVIGGGAGGLLAALSAKRQSRPGSRVTLVDAHMIGRSGHTAFSNAWTVVVHPEDDLNAISSEIIEGNDWVADQRLVQEVLATSFDRLQDLETIGIEFPRDENGQYDRRPTRGLNHTRVQHVVGGGLEFGWRLRQALIELGVRMLDRVFITGLLKDSAENRIEGAVGIDGRTGEFYVLPAKATIIATNATTFRSGFVRDITATGTLLAYQAGATLRNAEFSYLRPGTPKFYFEGITFAIQDGATFVNANDEEFMNRYEPKWGSQADVPRIARALAAEKAAGNDPIYLDMSRIPQEKRQYYFNSMVKWMDMFLSKLGPVARTDMFGKTPYFPLNQMTKMGVRTDEYCRSDVDGLLAAGLAQAGAANHFAGFHIGMCIGTGWIAGGSAARDIEELDSPKVDLPQIRELRRISLSQMDLNTKASSDRLLHELQKLMFSYDITVWKSESRLVNALNTQTKLEERFQDLFAPDVHELVRIRETEAMLLTSRLILETSLMRTESRMSHFRADYDNRDDEDWLCWIDITAGYKGPQYTKTPIPTPIHPVTPDRVAG